MMVTLVDARLVNSNAVFTVSVQVPLLGAQTTTITVPMATLTAASTPTAKRQVLLAAFKAQYQPPAPPVLQPIDMGGISIGDVIDLGA